MPVLDEASNPSLYRNVKDRNLTQQYYLLETCVNVSCELPNFQFTPDVLYALHSAAATFLDGTPGKIRDGYVHINNSKHTPPPFYEVPKYITEYFSYLNNNFNTKSVVHLAAYALWRLTWIHPFYECNGRTARAFCYYVICTKLGYWLPGENTIHSQIRNTINDYYQLLHESDENYKQNTTISLSGLEQYLSRLIFVQVSE